MHKMTSKFNFHAQEEFPQQYFSKLISAFFKGLIQGAAIDLPPPSKNVHPPKMTQNNISCHFESFLEGENFLRGVANLLPHPVYLPKKGI